MDKELYIFVKEMPSEGGVITEKTVSMNRIKEFIVKLISEQLVKKLEENNAALMKSVEEKLEENNAKLKKSVEALEKDNAELKKQVLQISQKSEPLFKEYNEKKTSQDNTYKKAINAFYDLNIKIEQCFPVFARKGMLNVLQMLLCYLYNPTDALLSNIESTARNEDEIISILKNITKFNNTLRQDLISCLSSIGKKWEDCVLLPNECSYNPSTMQYFNVEIEKGTPIYVVSLGYDFPKSNLTKCLPKVFPKKI